MEQDIFEGLKQPENAVGQHFWQGNQSKGCPTPMILLGFVSRVLCMKQEKAESLEELGHAMARLAGERDREAGPAAETVPCLDRLRRALLSSVAEPHFRIAYAALACMQKVVEAAPPAIEPMLDQLLPQLFNRSCDPKPQVHSPGSYLQHMPVQFTFTPAFHMLVSVQEYTSTQFLG